MSGSNTLAVSILVSAFLFLLMNTYYLDQGFSINLGRAALQVPMSMGVGVPMENGSGSLASFAVGILIQYSIVLGAVYLIFRGIIKSFEKRP